LAEAEGLFRESLAVRKHLPDNEDSPKVAQTLNTLSGVLAREGKQAEAEKVSRQALKIFGLSFGSADLSDADVLYSRGNVLFEQGKLAEAETCFRQALALRRKRSGGNDVDVAISALANTLRRQQKFTEAEPLFRECLAMRETNCPNAWYTFFTRMRLGATLMGKRNYEEAEPLIISGYEGMRQRQAGVRDRNKVLTESLQYLAELFDATSRPEQAADVRTKLTMVQAAGRTGKPVWPRFSADEQATLDP
jgi:tetratricopeptide (TPR) repeat protein